MLLCCSFLDVSTAMTLSAPMRLARIASTFCAAASASSAAALAAMSFPASASSGS